MYNLENPDYKGIAEYQVFKRLLETYPTGILSVVSDTFDLFKVITEYLPRLKDEILARDGKLVIRPDSGNPVDIICGIGNYVEDGADSIANFEHDRKNIPNVSPQIKGVIELLWDVFGGTVNEQGYKILDPHIGAIYGDSITIDRAEEICARLEAKGFASTNIVLGVGSFTYQYNTRDTFGFAMKATYVELEETFYASPESVEAGVRTVGREIFKDPITDDGMKKSATGLLCVDIRPDGELGLYDKVSWNTESTGELQTLYKDGKFEKLTTLTDISRKLKK